MRCRPLLFSLIALCVLSMSMTSKQPDGSVRIYANVPTSGLVISPNGNIGIGTFSPSNKLDVAGTVSASALVVNGTVTANAFVGDGSMLTGLPPTFATANANAMYVSQNHVGDVNINGTLNASVFAGAGTGLTGTAANLTAGTANAVVWLDVTSKPTTLTDYGITDAIITNNYTGDVSINGGVTADTLYGTHYGSGANLTDLPLVDAALTANIALTANAVVAQSNLQLNGKYLSSDGDNEGVFVDTNGNVGIGTTSPSTKLDIAGTVSASALVVNGPVNYTISTKTAGTYSLSGEQYILGDASSGVVVLNLPAASSNSGRVYHVKKVDSSLNTISIVAGSDLLDGAASKTLTGQWMSVTIICNGTAWYAF